MLIDELESKLNSLTEKVDSIINRMTIFPTPISVSLPEYLRSGQIFADSKNAYVIMILDSCIRTKCGLVHKWTYLQHFGRINAGKVNDDAEKFIEQNDLRFIGELKDYLKLDLPFKREIF